MIQYLFTQAQKREYDKHKFLAAIQGIDLENGEGTERKTRAKKVDTLEFRDPSEYADMTDAEKDELTKKMKSGHLGAIQSSGFSR